MISSRHLLEFERLLTQYQNAFESLHFAPSDVGLTQILARRYIESVEQLYHFVRNLNDF